MNNIKTISIDIETFSDIDLSKCGVYKYTESENFEILAGLVNFNFIDTIVFSFFSKKFCANSSAPELENTST